MLKERGGNFRLKNVKETNISSDVQPTTIAHQRAQIKKEDDDESMDGQRGPSSRSP